MSPASAPGAVPAAASRRAKVRVPLPELDDTFRGALDFATEIPTPHGLTTLAELRQGEYVFGSDGKPVQVLQASDVLPPRTCWSIQFSTGEKLVVDQEQELLTERRPLPRTSAVALRRAVGDVADGVADRGPMAYGVRVAPAIQLPDRRLPIDPYVLGAWLGAGVAHLPAIRGADDHLVRSLAGAGVRLFTSGLPEQLWVGMPVTGRRGADLRTLLRDLGVLDNKHLPMVYLRAGTAQRRDLLAGLLDSGAFVSGAGEIVFRTASPILALGVHQLIASLGFRPKSQPGAGLVDVGFVTGGTVFRRLDLREDQRARRRLACRPRPRRLVVSMEPVPARAVRKLRLASDDGVLLVGRSFIPIPGVTLPAELAAALATRRVRS